MKRLARFFRFIFVLGEFLVVFIKLFLKRCWDGEERPSSLYSYYDNK